jgi:His/Glu/Gln/Arg/opine family amino acid ABC transporter permease subunit
MDTKIFDFKFMISTIPQVMAYLPITLLIAVLSAVIALALGFLIAIARYFKIKILSPLCVLYVSYMRGTPVMVQLLLSYYGIPILLQMINAQTGTRLSVNGISPVVFAVAALAMNGAAYMSETIRSAIQSVDYGQMEACLSVNMTTAQAMRRVILPQAFTTAIAPIGNTFISLLKDTSLVFNISVVEIMTEAKIIGSRSFRFFEVYIAVSAIYWVCCIILEKLLALMEKGARKYERSAA